MSEKMNEFTSKINEVTEKSRSTSDPEEKELLHKEFWLLAVDAFNEMIAGDVVLADGRVLHTPEIEF